MTTKPRTTGKSEISSLHRFITNCFSNATTFDCSRSHPWLEGLSKGSKIFSDLGHQMNASLYLAIEGSSEHTACIGHLHFTFWPDQGLADLISGNQHIKVKNRSTQSASVWAMPLFSPISLISPTPPSRGCPHLTSNSSSVGAAGKRTRSMATR